MSRADKRYHTEHVLWSEHDMTRVKLYAFANTRPSYAVCFAPERPLIVLKTQRSNSNNSNSDSNSASNSKKDEPEQSKCNDHDITHYYQHANNENALAQEAMNACLQWNPLSNLVFERQPNTTHAVYVVDASSFCSSPEEKEEQINGAGVGEYLKSIRNVMSRLNSHNGTLIAAGVSCFVAFKYMLVGEKEMGHTDRLLHVLLLVRPPPVEFFRQLVDAVRRQRAYQQSCKRQTNSINHIPSNNSNKISVSDKNTEMSNKVAERNPTTESTYPLFDICVLVSGNDVARQCKEWELFLHILQANTNTGNAGSNTTIPLISSYRVSCEVTPTIFHAIAREANVFDEGISVDETKRFAEPRLYRINFALSRYTKAIEQHVHLCSHLESEHQHHHSHHSHSHNHLECSKCSTTNNCEGNKCIEMAENANLEENENGHEEEDEEEEWDSETNSDNNDVCEGEIKSASVVKTSLSSLENCTCAQLFSVEGRVIELESNLFGTTDGVIRVSNLHELVLSSNALRKHIACHARKGAAVQIHGHILRRENGCVELRATNITIMSSHAEEASLTAALHKRELPLHYNLSQIGFACGGLIIRGRKCALVRTMKPTLQSSLLHIPYTNHNLSEEDAVQCAVRAICERCDISSDNFYIPSYLPPVMMYQESTMCRVEREKREGEDCIMNLQSHGSNQEQPRTKCVMLFIALAINPPPSGPESDLVEDAPEPDEPYDWVSYERALEILSHCPVEQEALKEMHRHLHRAYTAGLYKPVKRCGLFGDVVVPLKQSQKDETLMKENIIIANKHLEAKAVTITTKLVSDKNKEENAVNSLECNLAGLEIIVIACPGLFSDAVVDSDDECTAEKSATMEENQQRLRTINSLIRIAFDTTHIYVYNGKANDDDNDNDDSEHETKYDNIAISASVQELIQQALQARNSNNNNSILIVLLNTWVMDVEEFCAKELIYLTQECHATARVFTLLSQCAINAITELTCVEENITNIVSIASSSENKNNDLKERNENTSNSQRMRHELFTAVQLSDALFLLPELHGKHNNKECMSILQVCKAVNNDLDIYNSLVSHHSINVVPLTVDNNNKLNDKADKNNNSEIEIKGNNDTNMSNNNCKMENANVETYSPSLSLSSSPSQTILCKDTITTWCGDASSALYPYLYCVTVSTRIRSRENESVPVAPAALAYLARPNSLKLFYRNGKTCLWWLHGVLWIATRPNARAEITLNCNAKCIHVDKGDAWEEHETRESVMHLYFWLQPGEELTVKALAEEMMEELCWKATRDGDDFTKLYDPLPEWE